MAAQLRPLSKYHMKELDSVETRLKSYELLHAVVAYFSFF